MIIFATLLWEPNDRSLDTSRCYDETWVERLYRGVARNYVGPFRLVVYTDKLRRFSEPVEARICLPKRPGYSDCIRPYEMGEPMILMGLDTVIAGPIDHLVNYCLTADTLALPRDPYHPQRACNGVALVPGGMAHIAETHNGQNDMEWLRTFPHAFIDDLFPGHVVSYKGSVERVGLADARIVYFHGKRKPHELSAPWIKEHWR